MGGFDYLVEMISIPDVYNGIIGGVLTAIIMTSPLYVARVGRAVLRWAKFGIVAKICAQQVLWAFVLYFFRGLPLQPVVHAVIALLMVGVTLHTLRAFIRLGIVDAHDKTKDGINFKSSLEMARSSIDFLGIGADKLTSLDTFEAAMIRCATGGNQVRFLLSPPGNHALERAAKRNGSDVSDYEKKVRDSLERIAKIKAKRDLNIVVKQYAAEHDKDLQQFRLMFIDNTYCLAGWTVWGSHVGTENPQLLLKRPTRKYPQNSAFKAFHDYFETIWESPESTPVDLGKI